MPAVEAEFDRIARVIEEAILRGQFEPDGLKRIWLPTQREMAVCFGCSTTTVQKAMLILDARGVIIRRQGKEAQVNPEWLAGASGASTDEAMPEPSPNGRRPAADPDGASTVRPHAEQHDPCR